MILQSVAESNHLGIVSLEVTSSIRVTYPLNIDFGYAIDQYSYVKTLGIYVIFSPNTGRYIFEMHKLHLFRKKYADCNAVRQQINVCKT